MWGFNLCKFSSTVWKCCTSRVPCIFLLKTTQNAQWEVSRFSDWQLLKHSRVSSQQWFSKSCCDRGQNYQLPSKYDRRTYDAVHVYRHSCAKKAWAKRQCSNWLSWRSIHNTVSRNVGGSRCIANHILRDTGNPYFLARTNHLSNKCTLRTHHYFRIHGQSGPHSESDWERGADLFCSAKLSSSARVPLARDDAKRAGNCAPDAQNESGCEYCMPAFSFKATFEEPFLYTIFDTTCVRSSHVEP